MREDSSIEKIWADENTAGEGLSTNVDTSRLLKNHFL
jgi:hypothetical protein